MPPTVRVRFAPSPTGRLHVGGARTALFNWALARRHGGAFVLRIEDTDLERSSAEQERAILAGLRWLGLDWDEGPDVGGPHAPYHQRQRLARHQERAAELLEQGQAFRCFCARARAEAADEVAGGGASGEGGARRSAGCPGDCRALAPERAAARAAAGEPCALRFAVPAGSTRLQDLVRGEVVFDNAEVEDWVMVRSDGNPTYNFVVVCDDIDMRITHVLRGEEHLVNTPKQVLLYQAFGAELPQFGHLPLMLGNDRKKLSKRTGDTALEDYREQGFPPEAVVNFLCLQGWALDGSTEVFSVQQLVENFAVRDVNKAGAVFDLNKFLWHSGEHIRRDSLERVAQRCAPFVLRAGLLDEAALAARHDWYLAVVAGEKERIRTYGDLPGRIAYLFAPDDQVAWSEKAEGNARRHPQRLETLAAFAAWLRPRLAQGVDAAALREAGREWLAAAGLKPPALLQPLRCALTGHESGPDVWDVIAWLGASATLARLEAAQRRLA